MPRAADPRERAWGSRSSTGLPRCTTAGWSWRPARAAGWRPAWSWNLPRRRAPNRRSLVVIRYAGACVTPGAHCEGGFHESDYKVARHGARRLGHPGRHRCAGAGRRQARLGSPPRRRTPPRRTSRRTPPWRTSLARASFLGPELGLVLRRSALLGGGMGLALLP